MVLRAYRFALDPNREQLVKLAQHAGAARWAFNYALAAKMAAHQRWREQVDQLVQAGVPEEQARKQVPLKIPNKPVVQKALNAVKGDDRKGIDGVCPWYHTVSTYAFQSAFADADTAWSNWVASLRGERAGRRVGYPRFKKKGRCRDSFRIHHDVKKPTIRPEGYRRLQVPRLGLLRLHGTAKPLVRALARGAVVQSVTISRGGHRWYAAVLVKQPARPVEPTRRQRAAGTVGVDLGVHHLAALSDGTTVDNPRPLTRALRRLAKAQRALARTQKGSARRRKAAARVGRLHHQIAERRAGYLHQLTKRLATSWACVAIEDLHVVGLTRSARGTLASPGRNVRAKAALNRAILDAAFGEVRRQLTYKTTWYGSRLVVCDRFAPTSKTCSACGAVKTKLSLDERVYRCDHCGLVLDRDVNAARNIAAAAAQVSGLVAPDGGETENARGGPVSPTTPRGGGHGPAKREDHRPKRGSPRPSNGPATRDTFR